jgi:hypothetical protein
MSKNANAETLNGWKIKVRVAASKANEKGENFNAKDWLAQNPDAVTDGMSASSVAQVAIRAGFSCTQTYSNKKRGGLKKEQLLEKLESLGLADPDFGKLGMSALWELIDRFSEDQE